MGTDTSDCEKTAGYRISRYLMRRTPWGWGVQERIQRVLYGVGADRRQQLRVRRFFMSLASYTMWYVIAFVCWRSGLLDVSLTHFVRAGAALYVTQFFFYFLIRSGLNLKFRDPSLTVMQILVGLTWALILVSISSEIRGLMLTVFMITLLFGIFALDKRQFLLTSLVAYTGYTALVLYEYLTGLNLFTVGYYVVSLILLAGVLLWTSMFGSYVSNLRHTLRVRNDELEAVLGRMSALADHDDLTGLLNRRVITEILQKLKARADRTGETFSVCIIDLDNFKDVNDVYGHLTGDRVLVEFANTVSRELRGMDLVMRIDTVFGRYGGEEFILLLPETDMPGALRCAERLRGRQSTTHIDPNGHVPRCTLSAGVAEYRPGEDIESILRRADRALYAAKHAGRNRVELAMSE